MVLRAAFGLKQIKQLEKFVHKKSGIIHLPSVSSHHAPKPLLSTGTQLVICNYRRIKYYKTNTQPSVDRWVSRIRCD